MIKAETNSTKQTAQSGLSLSSPEAGSKPVRRHQHRHNVKSRYEFLQTLGKGTYGKVKLAKHKDTRELVAVKTIRKDKIKDTSDMKHIRREIEIMASIQHENIIQIHEVFENQDKIVIVMEYASGGELYNYLETKRGIGQKEARFFFKQIVSAVQYCHKVGIVHRDLKLENILLSENQQIKIADFGLANMFKRDSLLHTFCGSPLYASPEIVTGEPYMGPEVDSWSLGVLLYALVYGTMPFDGRDYQVLTRQITSGSFCVPAQPSEAHGLITWMLTVDPRQRATIDQVADHEWLKHVATPSFPPSPPPEFAMSVTDDSSGAPRGLDLNDNFLAEDRTLNAEEMMFAESPGASQPRSILKRPEPVIEITPARKSSPRSKVVSDSILAGQLAAVCGLQAKDSLKLKTKPQTASGKRRVLRTKRDRESGYYSSPERAVAVSSLPDLSSGSADSLPCSPHERRMPHIKSALAAPPLHKGARAASTRPPRAPNAANPVKECYLMPISPPADDRLLPGTGSDGDTSSIGSQTRPASTYSDSSILSSDSFDKCNFTGAIFTPTTTSTATTTPVHVPQLPVDSYQRVQSYPGTPTASQQPQRPLSLSLARDTLPNPGGEFAFDDQPPSGTLTPKSEKLVRDLQRILAPNGRRHGARASRARGVAVDPGPPRPHSMESLGSNQLSGMMTQLNADLELAYKKALDICVNLKSAEV